MLTGGSHDHVEDPRNETVLIHINGELMPRPEAKISVFDSGFLLGDGVWEGIRLHNGQFVFGRRHIARLFAGAKALDIDPGMSQDEMLETIASTTSANEMTGGVHIRLILTRGLKITPYQHPNANVGRSTLVIIPEYKDLSPGAKEKTLSLFTVHVHRPHPDTQDPQLNSLSKLNDITACIQADKAGADEARMLDPDGFVNTCNSTNFFIVRDDELWTSTGRYCLPGITRQAIIDLGQSLGMTVRQTDFSLVDVYSADEVFVTGTFAGVLPVGFVDGRTIGTGKRGAQTERLQDEYAKMVEQRWPAGGGK